MQELVVYIMKQCDGVENVIVGGSLGKGTAVCPETADVDLENNYYPRRIIPSRIEAYKSEKSSRRVYKDLMQESKTELKTEDDDSDSDDD